MERELGKAGRAIRTPHKSDPEWWTEGRKVECKGPSLLCQLRVPTRLPGSPLAKAGCERVSCLPGVGQPLCPCPAPLAQMQYWISEPSGWGSWSFKPL